MIVLEHVWKKYYRHQVFHRSLREDVVNLFKKRSKDELDNNEFWALKDISFTVKVPRNTEFLKNYCQT